MLELPGTCVRVGGVGSAQIANACEQYVIAATAAALSEAAVIAERAGLDLSRVLQSWELSLAGSRVLGAARGKLLNRDFEPDLPAGPRCATGSRDSTSMADRHFSACLANVRELFELLDRAGLSSQGSDIDISVPQPHSTPSAGKHRAVGTALRGASERWEGGRGGQPLARAMAQVLRSGELKNHDHQNDDHGHR